MSSKRKKKCFALKGYLEKKRKNTHKATCIFQIDIIALPIQASKQTACLESLRFGHLFSNNSK